MAQHFRHIPETVHTCKASQDGNWLVITKTGKVGSSPVEIPVGARVRINSGIARRVAPKSAAAS